MAITTNENSWSRCHDRGAVCGRPAWSADRSPRIELACCHAERTSCLIVGAGVGGLTLAAGLQHFGIVPTVAEIEDSSLGRGSGADAHQQRRVGLAANRAGPGSCRRGDGSG